MGFLPFWNYLGKFFLNIYDKKTLNQTKNSATYVFRSTSKR